MGFSKNFGKGATNRFIEINEKIILQLSNSASFTIGLLLSNAFMRVLNVVLRKVIFLKQKLDY
jgi:hypothetical protein